MRKMRFTKKSLAVLLLLVSVLFGATGVYAGANLEKISAYLNHDINFVLDDQEWQPKDPDGKVLSPIIYNGSSYLPTRAIAEAVGAKVDWNNETKTIMIESASYDPNVGIPYKDAQSYTPVTADILNDSSPSAYDKIAQLAIDVTNDVYEVNYKNYDGLPDHPMLLSKEYYSKLEVTAKSEVSKAKLHSEVSSLTDFKITDVHMYAEKKFATVYFTAVKTETFDGITKTATHTYYAELVTQSSYLVVNSIIEKK
jgi:hypothetical protein